MPDADVELEVEYETALALDEATDNTATLAEWDGYEADVTLTRTLSNASWNTLAVPFSISAANFTALQTLLTAQGGSIKVKELTGSSLVNGKLTLTFADATLIEAGKPYLVKVSKELNLATLPALIDAYALANGLTVANPFKNVVVSNTAVPVSTDAVIFVPTLGKTLVTGPAGDESDAAAVLFLAAGNTLYLLRRFHPAPGLRPPRPLEGWGVAARCLLGGNSAAATAGGLRTMTQAAGHSPPCLFL
ncbi:MAG: hypothetical protein K6F72_04040 [Bacteroidales bacterium]|nr:hypothetical protein [Bacteroidales bacterium]